MSITTPFPIDWCRAQFPALSRQHNGQPVAFFDGPGGSQIPRQVATAVSDYLLQTNANRGGLYATSRQSDELLEAAHAAVADLVGARSPESIVFGANMTTLTFALSRALARTWEPGDSIVATRLDHDANVTPWVLAAQDAGVRVSYANLRPSDCTLDLDDLFSKITPRTKLVALGCASNVVGSIPPIKEICDRVHAVGGQICLDAVHFTPHQLPDVTAWDCDWLLCSAYKFFGPHVGVLYGRHELLQSITPYKLRPVTESLPGRWMTGTQNHEGIAGTLAAVEYLAAVGRQLSGAATDRRSALQSAYQGIGEYERQLSRQLLSGLSELRGVRVLGITTEDRLHERTPTISIVHERHSAAELSERLGRQGLFVPHGNFYALQLTETLGLEPAGVLRMGLMHYNTGEEVKRLLAALRQLTLAN